MKARVFVTLKNGVLDPQGKAIGNALHGLGFGAVGEVRQGKVIDLELKETDEGKARGIRANAIAPTAIRTGDNLKAMGDKTKYVERHAVAVGEALEDLASVAGPGAFVEFQQPFGRGAQLMAPADGGAQRQWSRRHGD